MGFWGALAWKRKGEEKREEKRREGNREETREQKEERRDKRDKTRSNLTTFPSSALKTTFHFKKTYTQKTGQTYQKNTITYTYLRGPLHAESSFDENTHDVM